MLFLRLFNHSKKKKKNIIHIVILNVPTNGHTAKLKQALYPDNLKGMVDRYFVDICQ